jgi:hypothetical protein
MGEPFSLALVGGAVIGEAVKFLFEQASSLIRAARERRAQAKQATEVPPVANVPVAPNDVLDGPVAATVDGRLLDQENRRLIALTGALAPYAAGDAEIDATDGDLMTALSEIRTLLEGLYGQRFTLRGEAREPSGTRVDVRQVLGTVRGGVVGVEAESAVEASVTVEQSASSVEAGGTVTGVRFGSIGPRRDEGHA